MVKGGEGWVKDRKQPFTSKIPVFIGISAKKVKGEGYFRHPFKYITIQVIRNQKD